ncbi:hypothetical protein ACFX11_007250 [Malus domestica]
MYKKADYDVKVSAVDITPYPVARGKPASFSISATISTSIFGGKLVIEVSYFGWHIHIETYDLFAETSCFDWAAGRIAASGLTYNGLRARSPKQTPPSSSPSSTVASDS